MMKKAFTLAEVLITLAIIGVVAAITIPSVIVNTNQMEFKTGLRKAVSVLNQAITLNKALTGESPYDNSDLFWYLQQNMSVMRGQGMINITDTSRNTKFTNGVFYTTDGMRFEISGEGTANNNYDFPLYENKDIRANMLPYTYSTGSPVYFYCMVGGTCTCGSLGLANNPDSTTVPPCIITVDVNGDRKPNPKTALNYDNYGFTSANYSTWVDPNGRLLSDIFSIMITDQGAIPYGVVAQKAMYQAQK